MILLSMLFFFLFICFRLATGNVAGTRDMWHFHPGAVLEETERSVGSIRGDNRQRDPHFARNVGGKLLRSRQESCVL